MPKPITLYHNPRCSKSRSALELLTKHVRRALVAALPRRRGRATGCGRRSAACVAAHRAGCRGVGLSSLCIIPRLMTNETEVAVLFADVVGSTRLYELLGTKEEVRGGGS